MAEKRKPATNIGGRHAQSTATGNGKQEPHKAWRRNEVARQKANFGPDAAGFMKCRKSEREGRCANGVQSHIDSAGARKFQLVRNGHP